MPDRLTYHVKVLRLNGTIVEGTMQDDGLQDLYSVEQADGTTAYVTTLDRFLEKEWLDDNH